MKKVLIVDDEENILKILNRALKNMGFEIITTMKIDEAEEAIKNSFFDVVIADIRLNDPDGRQGLELLPYIQEKSPKTKVMIMTGFGSEAIEDKAYDNGAFLYLEKPFNLQMLKKCLMGIKLFADSLNEHNHTNA